MLVHVYAASFKLTDAIASHARGRVDAALRAASERVESTIVRLTALNADRGGIDKSCRIVARLDDGVTLVVRAVDHDLYAAIGRAAERLRVMVKRRLSRRLTLRREHTRRVAMRFR